MLETEKDVLVIAHNICIAFDYLSMEEQERQIKRLREIEKDVCSKAQTIRDKEGKV